MKAELQVFYVFASKKENLAYDINTAVCTMIACCSIFFVNKMMKIYERSDDRKQTREFVFKIKRIHIKIIFVLVII